MPVAQSSQAMRQRSREAIPPSAGWFGAILTAVGLAVLVPQSAQACGPDSDCVLGERTYRIALPEVADAPHGAIVFAHGYRGSAAGTMASDSLRQMAQALGVALVAPKSGGEDWLIRNAPRKGFADDRRELAYFDALIDDITARHPIDPEQILMTGFSAGGMMTWTLACHRADRFAAFLPIAGTFWEEMPERCPNPPIDLVHINGTSDTIVPLTGRPIADTHQGNVYEALAMFKEAGGHTEPLTLDTDALLLECAGEETEAGEALVLCLHDGGHIVDADWIAWAYQNLVQR